MKKANIVSIKTPIDRSKDPDTAPPALLYFSAGAWTHQFPIGELRYPIFLVAKKYPVLFVEPPLTWRDWLGGGRRVNIFQKEGNLRTVPNTQLTIFTPTATLPYSVRLPFPRFIKNFILKHNSASIARQAMQVFHKLYPQKEKPDILWGTIFHHAEFLKIIPANYKLAIIDDNFPLSPVFSKAQQKEVTRMERRLIRCAQAIFTTSRTLFEEKRKINPIAYMLENGVSELFLPENRSRLTPFEDAAPATEREIVGQIRNLPHPRIGYVGAVNIRLKMPLIQEILNLPDSYHTIFVGNVDDSFPRSLFEQLKKKSNVHFYPFVSHALIPSLLEQFDALLLPFEETPFSRFINPLKLSEYLTSGKPIIPTPLPEVVRIVSQPEGLLYFANTPEEFRATISRAIDENNPRLCEERINLARTRTWEQTSREMIALVDNLLKTSESGS